MKIYEVDDFEKPFYIQDFKNEDHLIIALSSYGQKYEWFGKIRDLESEYKFSKLWVRDLASAYWHGNYPVLGDGPFVLAEFLKDKIQESKTKKVMMMGLSMGGYGAIMFGCLCNVDLVLSFSGQTYLPADRRKKYNLDEKWEGLDINRKYTDLKNIFHEFNEHNKTLYQLFFGIDNITDSNFAFHLDGQRGVVLNPVKTHKHNTVRRAFKSGVAPEMIKEFLK